MPVDCNIHPFMKGTLLVAGSSVHGGVGRDGTFEIKNIPAGKHEFQFWHEAAGYLKNLKFKGGNDRSPGPVELTIAAGQTLDLGDIKVPASMLK